MRKAVQARTEQLRDGFLDFEGRRSLETVAGGTLFQSCKNRRRALRRAAANEVFSSQNELSQDPWVCIPIVGTPNRKYREHFLGQMDRAAQQRLLCSRCFSWLGSTPVAVRGIHDCGIKLAQDLIRKLSQNLASTFRMTLSAWHLFHLRPRCASALRSALS